MKKNFKKLISLTFIFIIFLTLTGCGETENDRGTTGGGNKNYAFPIADFIPSGMEYKGSGKIEWSSKKESATPKYADAYVSNAKIEDVVAYVNDLKSKGLQKANAYAEDQTGFDEYGSFSWVGINDAGNFSISVTMTDESTKLNMVDASYNLAIVMSDENPYGE